MAVVSLAAGAGAVVWPNAGVLGAGDDLRTIAPAVDDPRGVGAIALLSYRAIA
jgi:hypothetical protein